MCTLIYMHQCHTVRRASIKWQKRKTGRGGVNREIMASQCNQRKQHIWELVSFEQINIKYFLPFVPIERVAVNCYFGKITLNLVFDPECEGSCDNNWKNLNTAVQLSPHSGHQTPSEASRGFSLLLSYSHTLFHSAEGGEEGERERGGAN